MIIDLLATRIENQIQRAKAGLTTYYAYKYHTCCICASPVGECPHTSVSENGEPITWTIGNKSFIAYSYTFTLPGDRNRWYSTLFTSNSTTCDSVTVTIST
jgi:hypothetical protein